MSQTESAVFLSDIQYTSLAFVVLFVCLCFYVEFFKYARNYFGKETLLLISIVDNLTSHPYDQSSPPPPQLEYRLQPCHFTLTDTTTSTYLIGPKSVRLRRFQLESCRFWGCQRCEQQTEQENGSYMKYLTHKVSLWGSSPSLWVCGQRRHLSFTTTLLIFMACKIFLHTNVYCVYDCVVGNLLVTRQDASLIFEIRVVILIFWVHMSRH